MIPLQNSKTPTCRCKPGLLLGLYVEWLCHEVLDIADRYHICIVDDCHFTSTRIPLGVHHALHVLNLGYNLLMRVMTAYLESAGLHVWTISMLVSIEVLVVKIV